MISNLFVSIIAVWCLNPVCCLYQHQIGTFDWYQKNIGPVIRIDFYQSSAIVGTSLAVVAAIQASDGSLIWRQVLPEQEHILGLVTDEQSSSVYVISGPETNPNLSIWSALDGSLKSMTRSFSSSNSEATSEKSQMQIFLTSSLTVAWSSRFIHAFDSTTAKNIYTITKESNSSFDSVTPRGHAVNLIDILIQNGSDLIFESADEKGTIVKSKKLALSSNKVIPLRGNRALLVSSSFIQDAINGELGDRISFAGDLGEFMSALILDPTLLELHFVSGRRMMLDLQQKKLSLDTSIPETFQRELCSEGVCVSQTSDKLHISKGRVVLEPVPFDMTEYGLIESVHCSKSICLISSADASLSCIQYGNPSLSWIRYEAIASHLQVLLVDRPTDQLLASLDHFPMLLQRLAVQYQVIKESVSDFISGITKMSFSALFSSENALPFDSSTFGMKKVILVLCRTRLFALCSLTGERLWSRSLIQYQLSDSDFLRLFSLPDVVLIAGRHALSLDISSGRIINDLTYPSKVALAVDYPLATSPSSSFLSVHLTSNNVVIFPKEMNSTVLTSYPYGYYFNKFDNGSRALEGFHTVLSQNSVEQNLIWRYKFPPDTVVCEWVANDPNEIVRNPVFLNVNQVLFKYFNRPFRAILTASGSTLSLLIVDGQTGQVLYRNEHPRCAERHEHCHVTVIENVVVYSFFNSRDMLFNIATVELFHNGPAKSQSFVFPNGICSLGATQTRRGITAKHIIVGMCTGQLYMVPLSSFIFTRETSFQPPMIHVNPLHIINYDRAVSRIRSVVPSSTELESATIITSAGLDLFTIRSHPSRPFDLLNSDFNFPLLLATVSAVAIGIFVSSRMAQRKQRALKWL